MILRGSSGCSGRRMVGFKRRGVAGRAAGRFGFSPDSSALNQLLLIM